MIHYVQFHDDLIHGPERANHFRFSALEDAIAFKALLERLFPSADVQLWEGA